MQCHDNLTQVNTSRQLTNCINSADFTVNNTSSCSEGFNKYVIRQEKITKLLSA